MTSHAARIPRFYEPLLPYFSFPFLCLLLLLSACSPSELPVAVRSSAPSFTNEFLVTADDAPLPYRKWLAKNPKAVILALHGYNDYSYAFRLFGEDMQKRGISVIAYDQRGFGKNKPTGIWPGLTNLKEDAKDAIIAVKNHYPNTPLYVLGSSMGGAVAVVTLAKYPELKIDGLILNAPAIWGGDTMNPLHHAMLWVLAHTVPTSSFTGEDLEIMATDNMQILHEMVNDPYVMKSSRIDSVYGLVALMEQAYRDKTILKSHNTLLLYGLKDEVIPAAPIYHLSEFVPESGRILYENGYHMLLRDKQRTNVFNDIAQWIDPHAANSPTSLEPDAQ